MVMREPEKRNAENEVAYASLLLYTVCEHGVIVPYASVSKNGATNARWLL